MKQGTVSVLLGCHSAMHSLMVILAWRRVYKRFPNAWQVGCILFHDIGHWGKDYLDDYDQKKQHGLLGAKVARFLFGQRGYDLVIGHNLYNGAVKSALHDPDKYSWSLAPDWWLALNNVFEPKLIRPGCSKWESGRMFKRAMRENAQKGFPKLGHDIYLEQWRGQKP